MHLLALSLQRPTAVSAAVYGNFSSAKAQEICVSRQNAVELLRPDETGKLISISYTPVFSIIRSIEKFRLPGANRDYLVIGSDSGKISIVEFDSTISDWKVVHCETYGKTGCRRLVPGQYIAVDPKGRALMIAAVERQKFVYVLSRDAGNRLTISSPLEAHKTGVILFSVVGMDVGFENPAFAMIELEYSEADQDPTGRKAIEADKKLTIYELDLGLNHVVRKWSEPIARTANILLAVPGGDDGPSGVLVCGENWISYKNQGHAEVRVALPRRFDMPSTRGVLITYGVLHKQKSGFFFLLQSEWGDLYKVSLQAAQDNPKVVQNVQVVVFDTIQPANSFCITRLGLLYVASEFANHALYQFQGLADDPSAVVANAVFDQELGDDSESASRVAPLFKSSPRLRNLVLVDEVASTAAVTDMLVETAVDTPSAIDGAHIYTVCGTGIRSTLRLLQPGIPVSEVAVTELPGRPTGLWSIGDDAGGPFDRYIVVTFVSSTIVLAVGDNVKEVQDSGFLLSTGTIAAALMADGTLIQVHNRGIRHIRGSAAKGDQRSVEWKPPQNRAIDKASINSRQVVISLSRAANDGQSEIIYFELNATGQLTEAASTSVSSLVTALDLGAVPEGRLRSSFLALGCQDCSVQLLSLEPGVTLTDLMQQRALMTVSAIPESLCLVSLARATGPTNKTSTATGISSSHVAAASTPRQLFLHVGLTSGVLVRVAVDAVSGALSDSRLRFLGPRAVRLCRVNVRGEPAVLALSQRPWLCYGYQGSLLQTPLTYQTLEACGSLSSDPCPEGILAIAGKTLRILTLDVLGQHFSQRVFPLRYTPRRVLRGPPPYASALLVTIESDQHEYTETEKAALGVNLSPLSETEGDVNDEAEATILPVRGPLPPLPGKWASCLRLLNPTTGETAALHELPDSEAAFSATILPFIQSEYGEEQFLVVGVAQGLTQHPRRACKAAFLDVYRFVSEAGTGNGTKHDTVSEDQEIVPVPKLVLLHRTPVEDVPLCLAAMQGRLLVGLGNRCLRLYDLGKKTLLRKCELRAALPTAPLRLQVRGDRAFVGDLAESVFVVRYSKASNALGVVAEDCVPRYALNFFL